MGSSKNKKRKSQYFINQSENLMFNDKELAFTRLRELMLTGKTHVEQEQYVDEYIDKIKFIYSII
jgi:hypothetical protein